ncbi:hypothetical protein K432DRAFT_97289 [Lepidopterella palustris CBS 459.81]|uniref:Uncharacterized protein n=1 Tax=Lepidopterella palustris CBS 459.81 TaxID=1314670 RepID=A0A8E2E6G6_9PEZI|nr:hypothetical protein K432DRAFT_97289 [Lepidopterella palustris CBS 459.81]
MQFRLTALIASLVAVVTAWESGTAPTTSVETSTHPPYCWNNTACGYTWHPTHSTNPPETITTTTTVIETLTWCPPRCSCTGQTTIWTSTFGPTPCPSVCTCVLPGAPKTLTICPPSVTCTGQTTTWSGVNGPSSCESTCTVALPSETIPVIPTGSNTPPKPTAATSTTPEFQGAAATAGLAAMAAFAGLIAFF